MKFASYLVHGQESYGLVTQNGIIDLKSKLSPEYVDLKSFLSQPDYLSIGLQYTNSPIDFTENEISFLPVIPNPNKILCLGMNYKLKREEFNVTSTDPVVFVRFPNSQTAHRSEILKPACTQQFDYEGELAVVIGKHCYRVQRDTALDYVAGYSCYMDGSVRDWQHDWFTAGKNWLKTGAFGPYLTTCDEVGELADLSIKTVLNKMEVQNDKLGNMITDVPAAIAYMSQFTPLFPGDVIIMGSPGGVGKKRNPPLFLKQGDLLEVVIEKVGHLVNFILEEPTK